MEDVLTIQRVSAFDDPDELYGGVDQQSIFYIETKSIARILKICKLNLQMCHK